MGSYIKIDRKILEWEWWTDINTHRLFSYMLLKANWKDGKFMGETIPRGSFVSSVPKLSEGTNLTIDEVRTALKHLKSTNEITSKSRGKHTIFTVNKYSDYQGKSDFVKDSLPSDYRELPEEIPSKSRAIPELFPTIEEKKEIKNERKESEDGPISQPVIRETRFNEFCELYPKKVTNILSVNGEYTCLLQTTPSLTEDDLIAAVKNYAEACRIQKTNERYIKNPENWLKDSTWINYLSENYKKPENEKPKNKFNQFQQNDYDFEELEKRLLSSNGGGDYGL